MMKTILVIIKNKFINLVKNLVEKCKSINFKRNKKRYFLVCYSFSSSFGSAVGSTTVISNIGAYFNMKIFQDEMKKQDDNIKDLVITNIIEFSKKDYDMFSAK